MYIHYSPEEQERFRRVLEKVGGYDELLKLACQRQYGSGRSGMAADSKPAERSSSLRTHAIKESPMNKFIEWIKSLFNRETSTEGRTTEASARDIYVHAPGDDDAASTPFEYR